MKTTQIKYTIIKVFLNENKYFLIKEEYISDFIFYLQEERNIPQNLIEILIGTISEEKLRYIEKYTLPQKYKGVDIKFFIEEHGIIPLKQNILGFLPTIISDKEFLILEPHYLKILKDKKVDDFNRFFLDSIFKKYVIIEHYFKILYKSKNIHLIISNEKAYIYIPFYNLKKNEIKKLIIDKKSVKLSEDMFIPYYEFKNLKNKVYESIKDDDNFLEKYIKIPEIFKILSKQKVSKGIKIFHFFNILIKRIFPKTYKEIRKKCLKENPGYKNYVYINIKNGSKKGEILKNKINENMYEEIDFVLNNLFSYNKTIWFYKPLSFLIKNIILNNGKTSQEVQNKSWEEIKQYFDYMKNNLVIEKSILKEVWERNFEYIHDNIEYYAISIETYISNWNKQEEIKYKNNQNYKIKKFTIKDGIKFLKEIKLENKFNKIIYVGKDLNNSKDPDSNKKYINNIIKSGLLKPLEIK